MKYLIRESKQYRKAFKRISKSGRFDREKLEYIIDIIAGGKNLHEKYKDHQLSSYMKDSRECHVAPNLLLIYRIIDKELVLILLDLGSHPDLFGK